MKILNINDLHHNQLNSAQSGELFSKSAVLSELLSFEKLFVHHEILAPGTRASSPHRHSEQEEMVVVLEGSPVVHLGRQKQTLKPGDCIGFSLHASELHFIENPTQQEVRILVICNRSMNDSVFYD